MVQAVESLPSKYEALSSKPSSAKKINSTRVYRGKQTWQWFMNKLQAQPKSTQRG
jgi:hypothetical protein